MTILDFQWNFFLGNDVPEQELKDVCMFRSDLLYDKGRRLEFGNLGSNHGDLSAVDYESFHVVALRDGKMSGTIRMSPLCAGSTAQSVWGESKLRQILKNLQIPWDDTFEINRLTVIPRYRKQGLGKLLMYAALGYLYNLKGSERFSVIGSSGNCDKQTHFFLHNTDYEVLNSIVPDEYSAIYNDKITLMSYKHPPFVKGAETIKTFANLLAEKWSELQLIVESKRNSNSEPQINQEVEL